MDDIVVGAKGEEDIVLRPKPVRDTAIIDPLFLHFVGVDDPDVTGAFKSWKPQQIQQRLDKLWGFLHDFERRWAGQCQHDCLEYSIWPWHVQEHFWGATVAHHSLKDPSHLQLIHIYPAVKEKDADNKHLNDQAAKIVTAFVQEAITRARNATSAAEPLTVTTHILHSTFSGLIPSLETMKVIVLVKLAVRAFQVRTQSFHRTFHSRFDDVVCCLAAITGTTTDNVYRRGSIARKEAEAQLHLLGAQKAHRFHHFPRPRRISAAQEDVAIYELSEIQLIVPQWVPCDVYIDSNPLFRQPVKWVSVYFRSARSWTCDMFHFSFYRG